MGYIYGQKKCPQFSIGTKKMAEVGCEIAAVYNALKMRGRVISCSSIIRTFEKEGYLMTLGIFGSDPYAIGEYLDLQISSYEPTTFKDYDDFYEKFSTGIDDMSTSHVYIISYWNSQSELDGLHTVCVFTYQGTIYAYNNNGVNDHIATLGSLDSLFYLNSDYTGNFEDHFIVGYYIPRLGRSM